MTDEHESQIILRLDAVIIVVVGGVSQAIRNGGSNLYTRE